MQSSGLIAHRTQLAGSVSRQAHLATGHVGCRAGLLRQRLTTHTANTSTRAAASGNDISEEDIEAQLEAFMQRQAEIESGEASRKRAVSAEPGKILGAAEVSEEDARKYCREVVNVLKLLKQRRDMSVTEAKLIVAIEDPRARERRLMGVEDASGVSREEMADALLEVAEGRVPSDRIALRELHREMTNWPFIDADEPGTTGVAALAPPTTPAADDAAAPWRREADPRPPMGRDPKDKPQGIEDMLPDWVGYGALYVVSIAPVLIVVAVVAILWANSLR